MDLLKYLSIDELKSLKNEIDKKLLLKEKDEISNKIKSDISTNGYSIVPYGIGEIDEYKFMFLPYHLKLSKDNENFLNVKVEPDTYQEDWVECLGFEYSDEFKNWETLNKNEWGKSTTIKVVTSLLVYYKPVILVPNRRYIAINETIKCKLLELRGDKIYINNAFYCDVSDWKNNMILIG